MADEPAAHFRSPRDNDETLKYTYDDLPEFRGPNALNEKNNGHPDTKNIEVTIEANRVSVQLINLALTRDVTIQLWAKRPEGWTHIDETELAANNDDAEGLDYQTEEIEFTKTPEIETHIATAYSLIIIDPPSVPEWDTHTPGRVLKTVRMFSIPYDSPDGRKTRIFEGETVNFESYRGDITPPTVRNTTVVQDFANGSKAVFAIVNTPRGEYGVSTTISQNAIDNQNYSRDAWTVLLLDNRTAENSEHFQNLAREIRTANQKLDRWGTLKHRLRAYADFAATLTYSTRGQGNMRHPTAALLSPEGRNCTEKTLIFNALLQCEPFNYSGEDASYIYCWYDGGAHLVAGVNIDKFDSVNSDWERYSYPDKHVEELEAPADVEFVPFDVTSGKIGRLSGSFANIRVLDNLEAEHGHS